MAERDDSARGESTDEFWRCGSSSWLAPTKTRDASPHRRLRLSAYDRLVTTLDAPRLPTIRLTELTDCGGCAAKLGADLLADALSGLGAGGPEPAELIAGLERADDAAVYRISNELAIIGTLDFFPPLVDDARTFGEIAAANALSDVFAMGGRVLFALSIAAFPDELPRDTMAAIIDGAAAKVREAGGTLAGGHTIRDPEPKYGLAVIGAAHPGRLLRKGGARPGDILVLTKRLGTGLLVSGQRRGSTAAPDLAAAVDQMRALNRSAAEVLVATGVAGATDVTGFGLLGHGLEMARASGTRFVFETAALPALDGALELARAGVETGGATHNRRFVASAVSVGDGVASELVTLAHDPQTSGGLLAAIPPDRLDAVRAALREVGVEHWIVGRVEAIDDGGAAGVALA
jgi:selenide, water dikinase